MEQDKEVRLSGEEEAIALLNAGGLNVHEVARKAGVSVRKVHWLRKDLGLPADYGYGSKRPGHGGKPERNAVIVERVVAGEPLRLLAKEYGISFERVRQISKEFLHLRPRRENKWPKHEDRKCARCGEGFRAVLRYPGSKADEFCSDFCRVALRPKSCVACRAEGASVEFRKAGVRKLGGIVVQSWICVGCMKARARKYGGYVARKRAVDPEYREKDKLYHREWYRRKRKDPAFLEKVRATSRKAYARKMADPARRAAEAARWKSDYRKRADRRKAAKPDAEPA